VSFYSLGSEGGNDSTCGQGSDPPQQVESAPIPWIAFRKTGPLRTRPRSGERTRRLADAVVIRHLRSAHPYGHPDPNALAELDGVGAQIWRTDQYERITITFTDQGPVVAAER
jgi:hypothetical protein